jgi:hypothetical protein
VINDTPEVREVPLGGMYTDLEGKGYAGKIELEPFTSRILFGPAGGPGKYITYSSIMSTKK